MTEDTPIGLIKKICDTYGDCRVCDAINPQLYEWCINNTRRPPREWALPKGKEKRDET